jgi:hypothetical protein
MATAITYYVHEGWREGLFTACLHRGDCIHCDEGRGQVTGSSLGRANGIAPFRAAAKQ